MYQNEISFSEIRFIPIQLKTQISCSAIAVGRVKEIKIMFKLLSSAIAFSNQNYKQNVSASRCSLKRVVCCIYVSDSLSMMCIRTAAFCLNVRPVKPVQCVDLYYRCSLQRINPNIHLASSMYMVEGR